MSKDNQVIEQAPEVEPSNFTHTLAMTRPGPLPTGPVPTGDVVHYAGFGGLNAGFVMTGLLDEITPTFTNDTENIVPLDVRQNFEVIIGTGASLTLVEILNQNNSAPGGSASGGTSGNCLMQIAFSADTMLFTFTRGVNVFTAYFVIGEYSESIRRGKSVGTLQVKPSGIAPTYT